MGDRMERVLSAIVALAAVVVAGAVVHREVAARPPVATEQMSFVADWRALLRVARLTGDSGAPVTLIEFTDLECPACRAFEETLARMREKYGTQMSVAIVHFPLPFHRFARISARAVECAAFEGRSDAMHAAVFRNQDSLGLRPWSALAVDAGLRDTVRWSECLKSNEPIKRIEEGVTAGGKIGVNATPTVIVNGWRFRSTPSEAALDAAIVAVLEGRRPPLAATTK